MNHSTVADQKKTHFWSILEISQNLFDLIESIGDEMSKYHISFGVQKHNLVTFDQEFDDIHHVTDIWEFN